MKVFVTNLRGFDERRQWMSSQMAKFNLDFEFIDCIDGRNWSEEEIKTITTPALFQLHLENKSWLTKGAIAATLTHRDLIHKKIVEENIPFALCLEDDTILNPKFAECLIQIEKQISHLNVEGVIMLHSILRQPTELNKLKALDALTFKIYELENGLSIASGAAYIITQNTAKMMIEKQTPLAHICDSWHEHGINVFFTHPQLVHTGMFSSTLGYNKSLKERILAFIIPSTFRRKKRIKQLRSLEKKNIL